jgi:hypothetical protein
VPPVKSKRSVQPDYIIPLEDGKKDKSLKRHPSVRGLTPEEYRQKWDLPRDYPMVAPNYAAARSQLAKKMGLGRKPKPAPNRKLSRRDLATTNPSDWPWFAARITIAGQGTNPLRHRLERNLPSHSRGRRFLRRPRFSQLRRRSPRGNLQDAVRVELPLPARRPGDGAK